MPISLCRSTQRSRPTCCQTTPPRLPTQPKTPPSTRAHRQIGVRRCAVGDVPRAIRTRTLIRRPDRVRRRSFYMADEREPRELTADELAHEDAAELPDREAMSLINANVAAPINAAVAANVLSDNSSAVANAIQDAKIDQSS